MKKILCFGDSNTWGQPPDSDTRFPFEVRWPGKLELLLEGRIRVAEEGLRGRTTCWDDPLSAGRNGKTYLPIALDTHEPIDLLIIMLGTNDVKERFSLSAYTVAQGAADLVEIAQAFSPKIPEILLVSPAKVVQTKNAEIIESFRGAVEKTQQLAKHMRYFAEKLGCRFFDAATVISSSPIDGIHLDAAAHAALAEALAGEVRRIFVW